MAALAAWMEELIDEQISAGQGLLSLPGAEEGGAKAFMKAWTNRVHEIGALGLDGADESSRPRGRSLSGIGPAQQGRPQTPGEAPRPPVRRSAGRHAANALGCLPRARCRICRCGISSGSSGVDWPVWM